MRRDRTPGARTVQAALLNQGSANLVRSMRSKRTSLGVWREQSGRRRREDTHAAESGFPSQQSTQTEAKGTRTQTQASTAQHQQAGRNKHEATKAARTPSQNASAHKPNTRTQAGSRSRGRKATQGGHKPRRQSKQTQKHTQGDERTRSAHERTQAGKGASEQSARAIVV